MSRSYSRVKGRRKAATFSMLPHAVQRCENYLMLSHTGRSLLMDFINQYNGSNNGDLVATFSILKKRGWKSKTTIKKHIDELLYYGFIELTQQGGINVGGKKRPNLFALTWLKLDKTCYSDGYSDRPALKVGHSLGEWKNVKPPMKEIRAKQLPPQLLPNKKSKSTNRTDSVPFSVPERAN